MFLFFWLQVCVIFSYVGVSIVLFIVSRFSPHEWRLLQHSGNYILFNYYLYLFNILIGMKIYEKCILIWKKILFRRQIRVESFLYNHIYIIFCSHVEILFLYIEFMIDIRELDWGIKQITFCFVIIMNKMLLGWSTGI